MAEHIEQTSQATYLGSFSDVKHQEIRPKFGRQILSLLGYGALMLIVAGVTCAVVYPLLMMLKS